MGAGILSQCFSEAEREIIMEHEDFPVKGFEFMNEPATEEQKDIIAKMAEQGDEPIDRHGKWPEPFSKWDAANMIEALAKAINQKKGKGK